MNKKQLWTAIDRARKAGGGWHGMNEPLQAGLSKLDTADIITWYLIFEKYRGLAYKQKLWAAAAAMMNGCSDDSFDYFRGWLIAQGKDVYLAALRDPDSLADVEAVKLFAQEAKESKGMTPPKGYYEEPRFEEILAAADYAYQRKTGNVGFYRHAFSSSLPVKTCQAIEHEIVYAPDMDVAWFGIDLPPIEIEERLQKLTPRLYQAFPSEKAPYLIVFHYNNKKRGLSSKKPKNVVPQALPDASFLPTRHKLAKIQRISAGWYALRDSKNKARIFVIFIV